MTYNQEPQPIENQYTVTVDEETGTVTASIQITREEVERRTQESTNTLIDKIWWCVRCGSGLKKSVLAYTEIDAGFGTCGFQSFTVSRNKCPEDD